MPLLIHSLIMASSTVSIFTELSIPLSLDDDEEVPVIVTAVVIVDDVVVDDVVVDGVFDDVFDDDIP